MANSSLSQARVEEQGSPGRTAYRYSGAGRASARARGGASVRKEQRVSDGRAGSPDNREGNKYYQEAVRRSMQDARGPVPERRPGQGRAVPDPVRRPGARKPGAKAPGAKKPAVRQTVRKTPVQRTVVKKKKAVRKAPPKTYVRPWERVQLQRDKRVSDSDRRQIKKIVSLNAIMSLVLMVAMLAVIVTSIRFLRLKSEYTTSLELVAEQEAKLSDLIKENEDYLNTLNTNVDLVELKRQAVSRLGMNLPEEDQVQTYRTSEEAGYLRQYLDIAEE